MVKSTQTKIAVLAGLTAVTVAIHYGLVLPYLFGHSAWVHAVHSRFCYVPIAVAAAWFGLRGGVLTATAISVLIGPFLFTSSVDVPSEHYVGLSAELVEIFFYYAFGILIGALVDRELAARRRQEKTEIELERSRHLSMVGQMAAGVAHEIKNPLASIKGAVEIVTDQATSNEVKHEFQDIISQEIKRIDGTVKGFLEFARPRSTRRERLNLTDTVETTITQMRGQLNDSGVQIESNITADLYVRGDSDKLHQALLNLLINASEASHTGDGIEVALSKEAPRHVVLSVRDHGEGIPKEELAKIFEPFYSTKASGSGLGLAIVKGIIEDHSGNIEVNSNVGEGTEFRLVFPEA